MRDVLDQTWPQWSGWLSLVTCVAAAVLLALIHLAVLPRLTEPPVDPEDPYLKPLYRDLLTPRFATLTITVAALAGAVASWGGTLRPALVVWAGLAALIAVDAATTYLPSALHWTGAVEMMLALLAIGLWTHRLGEVAWRALVGAAVLGALFWLLWWLPHTITGTTPLGFGDVRLMTLFGALVGVGGLRYGYLSLLLGTVAGAIHGLSTGWWRRRHPSTLGTMFPYGPGLWVGPWAALLVLR